jgi:hypothetical protein
MDAPLLPWWLVLLLGMWAAALTLWRSPGVNREVRLWAGLSTVVYLGLFFLVVGGGSRGDDPVQAPSLFSRVADVSLIAGGMCSLTAGVWMLGRGSFRSRQLAYVVLTVANGAVAALLQGPELAIGLLCVAALSAKPLLLEWKQTAKRSLREWRGDLIQFDGPDNTGLDADRSDRDEIGEVWLTGAISAVLAVMMVGTLAYSLRVETSRTTAGSRYTALPSRAQLDGFLSRKNTGRREPALIDLAFGVRADVVVLMAVIVFLNLAIVATNSPDGTASQTPAGDAGLSNGSEGENR